MTTDTLPTVGIEKLIANLEASQSYFNKSTSELSEEDSGYKPTEDMMTVAQQVAHTAHSIDWFLDGAVNDEGFDLDFEGSFAKPMGITSLKAAKDWLDESFRRAFNLLRTRPEEFWDSTLPEGPVMGGQPRSNVIAGIVEHTAHHRGALSVYTRTAGKVPPMPYM